MSNGRGLTRRGLIAGAVIMGANTGTILALGTGALVGSPKRAVHDDATPEACQTDIALQPYDTTYVPLYFFAEDAANPKMDIVENLPFGEAVVTPSFFAESSGGDSHIARANAHQVVNAFDKTYSLYIDFEQLFRGKSYASHFRIANDLNMASAVAFKRIIFGPIAHLDDLTAEDRETCLKNLKAAMRWINGEKSPASRAEIWCCTPELLEDPELCNMITGVVYHSMPSEAEMQRAQSLGGGAMVVLDSTQYHPDELRAYQALLSERKMSFALGGQMNATKHIRENQRFQKGLLQQKQETLCYPNAEAEEQASAFTTRVHSDDRSTAMRRG